MLVFHKYAVQSSALLTRAQNLSVSCHVEQGTTRLPCGEMTTIDTRPQWRYKCGLNSPVWCTSHYLVRPLSTWRTMFSFLLTADGVSFDQPTTEHASFLGHTTVLNSFWLLRLRSSPTYLLTYLLIRLHVHSCVHWCSVTACKMTEVHFVRILSCRPGILTKRVYLFVSLYRRSMWSSTDSPTCYTRQFSSF